MALFWAASAQAGEVQLISAADPSLVAPWVLGSGEGSKASQNGRYVLFQSSAPNVVPGQIDPNGATDIFVRDRVAGTTTLVSRSHNSPVTTANRGSQANSISADGRWVAFTSIASNLVSLPNGLPPFSSHVYLFDRTTGTMVLVSRSAGSSNASSGLSHWSVLSADGNYLAFTSTSTGLVTAQTDTNGGPDVFLYDRAADTVTLVSRSAASATTAGSGSCGTDLALSADGRYIAFQCDATDLVTGQTDTNNETDVFLYDRVAGTTSLVSRSSASATTAAAASAGSGMPRISADGRYVNFFSDGTDLVAGQVDTPNTFDVFLYDRVAGSTTLVSRSSGNPLASAEGFYHDISADGSYVAFTSDGTSLVPGQVDGADTSDLFLFERATGIVTLVSHTPGLPSTAAGALSAFPRISDDGAWTAFESSATNLVAGQTDTNGATDSFLYERATGTVRLASRTVGSAVTAAESRSFLSGLSGDGGIVVITSASDDLVVPDTNGGYDGFVYDRDTQTVSALSITDPVTGLTGDRASLPDSVSADGRWVTFISRAQNLIPGFQDYNEADGFDVFLYDRVTGSRKLVSHTAGAPTWTGNRASFSSALSADGRYVAYNGASYSLVPSQNTGFTIQTFLYDRLTDATVLVSRRYTSPTAGAFDGSSFDIPALSAEGRYVAWNTQATQIVSDASDGNQTYDVFLFDRVTGTNTLVSRNASNSATGDGSSGQPSISADGRYVAFLSQAGNLVAGQTDPNAGIPLALFPGHVFLNDRGQGSTTLVSRSTASAATTGDDRSGAPLVSADGRFVVFGSLASDLVPGQTDAGGQADVFLYDREAGTMTLVSHTAGSPTTAANSGSGGPSISADGRWIAYTSAATDLVPGITDTNSASDIFLFDRLSGMSVLVSRSGLSSTAADAQSVMPRISAYGSHIVFTSEATDLVPGQVDVEDTEWSTDVFLYDRVTGTLALASRRPDSEVAAGNFQSGNTHLSADGRVVAFASQASDLAPGDFNGDFDAFLFTTTPPGSFFTLPACRLLDTRQPQDGPALNSAQTETLSLHGVCGIPATARALAVNVTVTQPTGAGHLVFYPGDVGPPAASTINFGPGQTRANNAILSLALNGTGTVNVSPAVTGNGTVHLILDVVGYFE